MQIPPINFVDECDTCGMKQVRTLHVTTIEVPGPDPDEFAKQLIKTFETRKDKH